MRSKRKAAATAISTSGNNVPVPPDVPRGRTQGTRASGETYEAGLVPLIGPEPLVLILGSFPGRVSLARAGYYAHPRNRFWQIMGDLFGCEVPDSYQERVRMLQVRHVALWDVVASCTRTGSSDASVREIEVNDIPGLLRREPGIRCIALNGRTAERIFLRSFSGDPHLAGIPVLCLPSTSPAHAAMPPAEKIRRWREILPYLAEGQQDAATGLTK